MLLILPAVILLLQVRIPSQPRVPAVVSPLLLMLLLLLNQQLRLLQH